MRLTTKNIRRLTEINCNTKGLHNCVDNVVHPVCKCILITIGNCLAAWL